MGGRKDASTVAGVSPPRSRGNVGGRSLTGERAAAGSLRGLRLGAVAASPAPGSSTPLAWRPGTAGDVTDLARAACDGDERAWRGVIERYGSLVRAVALGHRLSDADLADAMQNTWLRAIEHLDGLRDPKRLPTWLVSVARRECLLILGANARRVPVGDRLLRAQPDPGPSIEARVLAAERRDALRRAVEGLCPRQRRLLALLASDAEPSYERISSELDMPIGSIGPTRFRAFRALRGDPELAGLADAA
jgi:RNA polymerase sigma factor (sigma-70 family)